MGSHWTGRVRIGRRNSSGDHQTESNNSLWLYIGIGRSTTTFPGCRVKVEFWWGNWIWSITTHSASTHIGKKTHTLVMAFVHESTTDTDMCKYMHITITDMYAQRFIRTHCSGTNKLAFTHRKEWHALMRTYAHVCVNTAARTGDNAHF